MKNIVISFWECINNAEFDNLNELMSDEACIYLPNTREVFKGKDRYINFNKRYPDRWYVDLENMFVCEDTVISCAKIFNENKTISLYVNSFFNIKDELIVEITEYWGENGQPPQWRINENLSERY